jgi:hypothetical protein
VVKLVTHSKFLMVDSYNSRTHPTGPEGSLPSVKEYHESDVHQDSKMGRNALGARALGSWPLVCPFLVIPKCPRAAVEPTMGQPSNPWTVNGPYEHIQLCILFLPVEAYDRPMERECTQAPHGGRIMAARHARRMV